MKISGAKTIAEYKQMQAEKIQTHIPLRFRTVMDTMMNVEYIEVI